MKFSDRDAGYMALALKLAAKGRGRTSPNPMVGAVIVSGSRIVGRGYHRRAGGPHAERVALRAAGSRAKNATLYVTLEPCCHLLKRTPPCVPLLLDSGLRRIVVAMPDPNPRVAGRGIRRLRQAGLQVEVGCLREQAERLNEAYSQWVQTGRPYVLLKAGMTVDGKIATAAGESQWITGRQARKDAHGLRSQVDAVMVGVETVLHDDPRLTARRAHGTSERLLNRQPIRIVLDSRLRVPEKAAVLQDLNHSKTIVATTERASRRRIAELEACGVTVLMLPEESGRVSLRACLERLGTMGVTSVLVEGGAEVNASALRAGVVNEVCLYVAPLFMGGHNAKGLIGGPSPKRLGDSIKLYDLRVRRVGSDLKIEAKVSPNR